MVHFRFIYKSIGFFFGACLHFTPRVTLLRLDYDSRRSEVQYEAASSGSGKYIGYGLGIEISAPINQLD